MVGTKEGAAKRPQTFKPGNKASVGRRNGHPPITVIAKRFAKDEHIEMAWNVILKGAEKGDPKCAMFICSTAMPDQKRTMHAVEWDKPFKAIEDIKEYLFEVDRLLMIGEISHEEADRSIEYIKKRCDIFDRSEIEKIIEELKGNKSII